MRSRGRLAVLVLAGLFLLAAAPRPAAGAPPVLPVATYGNFLTNLSLPAMAPGQSESVGFSVADPLPFALHAVRLTFEVYAFNAYPGNATGSVPSGVSPTFVLAGSGGTTSVNVSVGALTPTGAPFTSPGSVTLGISAPSGAPDGTYAIRTSLTFTMNGTGYVLESRGFFTDAQWRNATTPGTSAGHPTGSTLNVSRLGVSGVIPESAVLVHANPFPIALAFVLGGALVLAALGGYWTLRRGPGSRSGTAAGLPPNQAETALGKRRSNDGD